MYVEYLPGDRFLWDMLTVELLLSASCCLSRVVALARLNGLHAEAAMFDDFAGAVEIFEVTEKHQFEKRHRINALLSLAAIVRAGGRNSHAAPVHLTGNG